MAFSGTQTTALWPTGTTGHPYNPFVSKIVPPDGLIKGRVLIGADVEGGVRIRGLYGRVVILATTRGRVEINPL